MFAPHPHRAAFVQCFFLRGGLQPICGSKLNRGGCAGFGPCLHLPIGQPILGTGFLGRLKGTWETGRRQKQQLPEMEADIDAVNSNGKQIISAMNSQHSAINKNLGDAAKQIFDLNHEEAAFVVETLRLGNDFESKTLFGK